MNKRLRKKTLRCLLTASILGILSNGALSEKLDLSEGTMTIKGLAKIEYDAPNIATFGTFKAAIDWGIGYFAADNFLIGFDVMLDAPFMPGSLVNLGLGPAFDYFFETESIFRPYIGLGARVTWGRRPVGADRWAIGILPEIGVLLGLNAHVALDLGLNADFNIPFSGDSAKAATSLTAAIGHVGVRAFF